MLIWEVFQETRVHVFIFFLHLKGLVMCKERMQSKNPSFKSDQISKVILKEISKLSFISREEMQGQCIFQNHWMHTLSIKMFDSLHVIWLFAFKENPSFPLKIDKLRGNNSIICHNSLKILKCPLGRNIEILAKICARKY